MEIKKKFIIIISIILVLNSFLIIVNRSANNILKDDFISKKISDNVSIKRIIYSKRFKKNKAILNLRNDIDTLYTLFDTAKVDKEIIDKILESKIFKETFTMISLNYLHSLRDNKYYKIFDLDDYEKIVDNNIDELLEDIGIDVLKIFKRPIVSVLKKMGTDIVDGVPTTEKAIKSLPLYKRTIIKLILSETIYSSLIIVSVILFILLIILKLNYSIISSLILINIGIILLLSGSSFILTFTIGKYNNEWSFIGKILNSIDNKMLFYQIGLGLITLFMIIVYKIKKSIAK